MDALSDRRGRRVRYLRLSITDRCNLRCLYCRGRIRQRFIPHADILRYEEMLRVVSVLHGLGVSKVRLTGGEPFARLGCGDLLLMLRRRFPGLDLRLTTNGTLLEPHIPLLKEVGVTAVNLSLDSFDRAAFARVTGHDLLPAVLSALDGLLRASIRVKINAVAMRGVNDDQIDDFVHVARTLPIDLRFIEFMPIGETDGEGVLWTPESFWPADEVRSEIERRVRLLPETTGGEEAGPARMFRVEGGRGRLGFITAVSEHFCATCNRLRLTSDGNLRACLFDDREYPLRPLLRDPKTTEADLVRTIRAACLNKPVGADLLKARIPGHAVAARSMAGIGG